LAEGDGRDIEQASQAIEAASPATDTSDLLVRYQVPADIHQQAILAPLGA
jgi:hypothetical protein